MFHTSGIKNVLIDSVYDRTNFRTEFRFDSNQVYLSNMRLVGLGALSNNGALGTKFNYNSLVGTYGIVKQITLYDGNETLSNMVDFNRYSAFKSFTTKNDDNNSVIKYLQQNNLGYVYTGLDVVDPADPPTLSTVSNIQRLKDPGEILNTEETTGKGWLSLRDCIPFLSASQYVPTNVFKNLRLVVEYDTNSQNYAKNAQQSFTTIEPFLIADMMVNSKVAQQMMMEYKSLSWVDVETDRVVLPSISPTDTSLNPVQEVKFNVNGFNNKLVNRVVMCNQATSEFTFKPDNNINADSYTDFSNIGSMGMLNQSLQVVVNGSNLFTEPVDTANKRLAMVVDNYRDAVMPLGYAYTASLVGSTSATSVVTNSLQILNNTDYSVFNLGGQRVQELVLEYKRMGQYLSTATAENQKVQRFNQQLNLVLYAEVQKQLVLGKNDNYVIQYV
jgi:hypothetical protein